LSGQTSFVDLVRPRRTKFVHLVRLGRTSLDRSRRPSNQANSEENRRPLADRWPVSSWVLDASTRLCERCYDPLPRSSLLRCRGADQPERGRCGVGARISSLAAYPTMAPFARCPGGGGSRAARW